jgi:hypothetical protein
MDLGNHKPLEVEEIRNPNIEIFTLLIYFAQK